MDYGGYKIRNQAAPFFITIAVVGWVDVFTRKAYRDIFLENIKYCQENKGLLLHSWCLMSNHIHLIASAKDKNLSNVMRDLKKFSSIQIIKAIEENKEESRKEWMLPIFKNFGLSNTRNTTYQFWQQSLHPIELYSKPIMDQRTGYTHYNPVRAGIVEKPEDYKYSSARDYLLGKKVGLLDVVFL
jgi:putative transposase